MSVVREGGFIADVRGGVSRRHFVHGIFGTFLLAGFSPARAAMMEARETAWVEQTRQIGMALFAYASDNNENYPDGRSSTAIFQTLLDGRYLSDPAVLLLPLPNKTEALAGQRLKPENVCFDMTCCLDISAPDLLPLVYMTGYKVTYKAGGSAVPVAKPPLSPGIAVMYKSNSAKFLRPSPGSPDGAIANFIPLGVSLAKPYHQLTPDGTAPQ